MAGAWTGSESKNCVEVSITMSTCFQWIALVFISAALGLLPLSASGNRAAVLPEHGSQRIIQWMQRRRDIKKNGVKLRYF